MRAAKRPLPTAALLIAAAVAAPAASAAAPWSAPVTISAPHTFIHSVQLTHAGTSKVAWWTWQDGVGEGSAVGGSMAARPVGPFGLERSLAKLPADLLDIQGYGDGRLLALSQVVARQADRRPPRDLRDQGRRRHDERVRHAGDDRARQRGSRARSSPSRRMAAASSAT